MKSEGLSVSDKELTSILLQLRVANFLVHVGFCSTIVYITCSSTGPEIIASII